MGRLQRFVADLAVRLRSLMAAVTTRREDRELAEEIRFHIDKETEKNVAAGLRPREARRQAHIKFGGVERMREKTREARGLTWLDTLWTDLRLAHRGIMRTPGQSIAAVLTLGLGIGVATTQFGTLYSVFYRTLPFPDAERFVWISQTDARGESLPVPVHDFEEWRAGSRSLRDLGGVWTGPAGVRTSSETWRLQAAHLTWSSLDIVGAQPVLGRGLLAEDDRPGAPLVALLSHRVWQERFDSDPATIGREVTVNGEPATVVGIMPEGFHFPWSEDLWLPLRVDASVLPRGEGPRLTVFGHVGDGVTLEAAMADMSRLAALTAAAHPETNDGVGARVDTVIDRIGEESLLINWILMLAALAVLLIACVNVANLLLARAAVRTREVALRSALGARRHQAVLHMLAESLTLALYGALLGGVLGWAGVSAIARAMGNMGGAGVPYWLQFKVDGPVLVFTALSAMASGVVAGLFPALRATTGDVAPLLKDGSRGSSGLRIGRLSRMLVGVEVAFSVAVLVAAGLMSKSVLELARFDLPFEAERVLAAHVDLFTDAGDMPLRRVDLLHEALDRARELPGVEGAALASTIPGWSTSQATTEIEGSEYAAGQDAPLARVMAVSPGFFEMLGVGAVAGRTFATLDERGGLPVAVVNESFALAHFPEADPIGRRVRVGVQAEDPEAWRTVVGVVPDLLMQGLVNVGALGGAGLYVPTTQSGDWAATLLARTEGAPLGLRDDLQELLRSVDPDLGMIGVGTLSGRIAEPAWYIRITAWIFVAFGLIALFLACVGLAGVVAFESERRTQEVGVRMALGARARDVAGLIVGHGVRQVALGIAGGLLLAAGLARGLVIILFETDPNDPLLYVGAAVIVVAVAALASLYPALRAAHADPVKSLQAR